MKTTKDASPLAKFTEEELKRELNTRGTNTKLTFSLSDVELALKATGGEYEPSGHKLSKEEKRALVEHLPLERLQDQLIDLIFESVELAVRVTYDTKPKPHKKLVLKRARVPKSKV